MRFFVTVLALFALLAPQAAQAKRTGERSPSGTHSPTASRVTTLRLRHRARDRGRAQRRPRCRARSLHRPRGRRAARAAGRVQAPVHAARPPRPATWSSWTAGASRRSDRPSSTTTATAPSAASGQADAHRQLRGQPLGFAEDVDVLPNGEYVVSESIFGGLWLIGRDGTIRRGLVPDDGAPAAAQARPVPGQRRGPARSATCRSRLRAGSSRAPARSRSTTRLYISSTCEGGMQNADQGRCSTASKPAVARGEDQDADAEAGRPREPEGHHVQPLGSEGRLDLRGRPVPPQADPRQLAHGQARGALRRRAAFNFTIATTFLPPVRHGAANPLITTSDQEYRWSPTNARSTASTTSSCRSSWPSSTRRQSARARSAGPAAPRGGTAGRAG